MRSSCLIWYCGSLDNERVLQEIRGETQLVSQDSSPLTSLSLKMYHIKTSHESVAISDFQVIIRNGAAKYLGSNQSGDS